MKKIMALLLTFLMIVSLAACASADEGKTAASPLDTSGLDDSNNKVVIYSGAEEYRNEYFLKRLNEEFPDYGVCPKVCVNL